MNDRAENLRLIKQNAGKPKLKAPKYINKISAKKQAKLIEEKEGTAELWDWFEDRRREMKGVCQNCLEPTSKKDDKYFHFCIAHILPKRFFPSLAKDLDNWLELCYFGKGCHPSLDNCVIDLTDLHCWDDVVEKFQRMYPRMAKEERKHIPETLRQYITVDL